MLNKTLYNQSNPIQSNTSEELLNTKTIIQKRSLKIDRILENICQEVQFLVNVQAAGLP